MNTSQISALKKGVKIFIFTLYKLFSHRDLYLNNKRLGSEENCTKMQQQEDLFGKGLSLKDFIADCLERKFSLKQMNELLSWLDSSSLYQQYFAAIGISKLLTLGMGNFL